MLPITQIPLAIQLACQWEVLAAKPGNVHRTADFGDTGLVDFLSSGAAVAAETQPWLIDGASPQSSEPGFGDLIHRWVKATRRVTSANTNLGICLMLGPLVEGYTRVVGSSAAPSLAEWQEAVRHLIAAAGVEQTRAIYAAIAAAGAGGLGQVSEADVTAAAGLRPTDSVLHVMGLAAERDTLALEYVQGFPITFQETAPALAARVVDGFPLQWSIIATYLQLLAKHPDTLIARKTGRERAEQVSRWAAQLCESYFPSAGGSWARFAERAEACEAELADFDFWLRSDGNRLNPGTTADLMAAGLLVALMSGGLPLRTVW